MFLSAKKQGKPHVFWVQRLQGERVVMVSQYHVNISPFVLFFSSVDFIG